MDEYMNMWKTRMNMSLTDFTEEFWVKIKEGLKL